MKVYTRPELTELENLHFETICANSGTSCLKSPGIRTQADPSADECQQCLYSLGLIKHPNHGQAMLYLNESQCPGGFSPQ